MISLSICEKLLQLAAGTGLPASSFKNSVVDELVSEGIILEQISGRTKRTLFITEPSSLYTWLYNRYTITNLEEYVRVLRAASSSRADLVSVSNDSKAQSRRTYKGFLVNSFAPIETLLNGAPFFVNPVPGTFQFVYDYEHFIPAADVTVVGVENMENFRHIDRLAYLFEGIRPLFLCRYPQQQAKDMQQWLLSIPNPYLHFGDFDFAGINIYLQEYKRHLGERASFFIPQNIAPLVARYGNPKLYDKQELNHAEIAEQSIRELIELLHFHKKGLEQEALLIESL
jgi:hypothetical protein